MIECCIITKRDCAVECTWARLQEARITVAPTQPYPLGHRKRVRFPQHTLGVGRVVLKTTREGNSPMRFKDF